MTITDPAIAAAHVTLEIADGDRFTTTIIVRDADFAGDASATQALKDALTVHDMRWPGERGPVRVDVPARWDIHGVEIDVDKLELPHGSFITVVVTLSTLFEVEEIPAVVFADIRRAIEAREDETGSYLNRFVYLVTQEQR